MNKMPKGLVFFKHDLDDESKKRGVFWFVYFVICALATIWPLYLIANRIYPMILGMPFSMIWVAAWIIIVFIGTMSKFKQEYRR